MPSFDKGGGARTPFGKNEYRRSTKDLKYDSFTFAKSGIPTETIDGYEDQKVLQPGTIIAKITTGDDAGKVGVFDRGTPTNEGNEVIVITRTATGGTTDFSLDGAGPVTGAVVEATTAAQLKAILEGLPNVNVGDITVTGAAGGPFTVTFVAGPYAGVNAPDLDVDDTNATGGTVLGAITQGGQFASGATDGRGDPANIVGVNDTFLPWQLMERDVEIAVCYEGTLKQAWCFEYVAGVRTALTNATRDQVLAAINGKNIGDLKFR